MPVTKGTLTIHFVCCVYCLQHESSLQTKLTQGECMRLNSERDSVDFVDAEQSFFFRTHLPVTELHAKWMAQVNACCGKSIHPTFKLLNGCFAWIQVVGVRYELL